MSNENIQKFATAAASNPELANRVRAIQAEAARETAKKIAALSSEVGTPFSAEDFLTSAASSVGEVSEEQLESVAGGTWGANDANVITSLMTLGIGCGFIASASVMITGKQNADDCQPSEWGRK